MVPVGLILKDKNYKPLNNKEGSMMELIITIFLSIWISISAFLGYQNVKKEYTRGEKRK